MSVQPFMPERHDPLDRRDVEVALLPYRSADEAAHNARLLGAGAPLHVYVDDERTPALEPERWVVVRSAWEAVELLRTREVAELSLDHDLGAEGLAGVPDDVRALVGDGLVVAQWLLRRLGEHDDDRVPHELNVHSGNAAGTANIVGQLASIGRLIPFGPVSADRRTWRRRDR